MFPSCKAPRHEFPSELSDLQQAFDVLDIDRGGKISKNDLLTFYWGYSTTNITSDEDIRSMILVADENKDGYVELGEFERVLGCEKSLNVMDDVFKVMDKNGDGIVGFEDLRDYMKWAKFYTTDDNVRMMIRLGGGDESAGVSYEGLLKDLRC
ncbi:hypothetical protein GIB67_014713 [Kingdonia uniflora]|uniref:EF-hand domain-containing protein n=1 Tax=Kingdonia uniflora TaxID=39325 RepID=A0A7J7NUP4_9MAGN|nr:hypothetical protein GIB67_014713 [Kingdonia uniflora]